jgi:hypothetical protein
LIFLHDFLLLLVFTFAALSRIPGSHNFQYRVDIRSQFRGSAYAALSCQQTENAPYGTG